MGDIDTLKRTLANSQTRTFPHFMSEFSLDLIVHKGVFPPEDFQGWRWCIQHFPTFSGERILEIGCGFGLPAIYLAKNGAASVVAVDINPRAVWNTIENAKRNAVTNISVFESDIFSAVPSAQQFDTIYWNFPCNYVLDGYECVDDLERGALDPGYRLLRKFLAQAHHHLDGNGRILLSFGKNGRDDLLREIAVASWLSLALLADGSFPETGVIYQLYELRPLSRQAGTDGGPSPGRAPRPASDS